MFSNPKTTETQLFFKEINVFQAPETQKMQKSQKTQLSQTFWGWGWQLAISFKNLSFFEIFEIFELFATSLKKLSFFSFLRFLSFFEIVRGY